MAYQGKTCNWYVCLYNVGIAQVQLTTDVQVEVAQHTLVWFYIGI